MGKTLFNKLHLKKQLYKLRIAEGLLVKGGSNDHGGTKEKGTSSRNNSKLKSRSKKDKEVYHCSKKEHYRRACRKYKAKTKDGKKVKVNDSASAM